MMGATNGAMSVTSYVTS